MKDANGLVIGFTGSIASGKTTLARGLVDQFGFLHLRSRNVLAQMLRDQGESVTEENLQIIGKKVIEDIGGRGLSALVLADYEASKDYAYDSIRHVADLDYFRERFGKRFRLLFIDSPKELRKERYLSRDNRDSTLESFHRRINHPVEYEIPLMRQEASAVIINTDFEESISRISDLIRVWR